MRAKKNATRPIPIVPISGAQSAKGVELMSLLEVEITPITMSEISPENIEISVRVPSKNPSSERFFVI
jgi:hypothetical protein